MRLTLLQRSFFPAPCRICGQTLLTASRIPICADCLSFQPIVDPLCDCCGRPFISQAAADAIRPLCRLCRLDSFSFARARSYAVYNDALHSAILLLKYEEVTRLGDWFAAMLAEVVAREPDHFQADVAVPVPLHPDRFSRAWLQPGGSDCASIGTPAEIENG